MIIDERLYEVGVTYDEEWAYLDGDHRPGQLQHKYGIAWATVVAAQTGEEAIQKVKTYLTSEIGMEAVAKFESDPKIIGYHYGREQGRHTRGNVMLESCRPLRARNAIFTERAR